MGGSSDISSSPPTTLSKEFLSMLTTADAEELDEVIDALCLAIVCASQWRNSFAPAACLPGDVLLLIFELGLENRDTSTLRSLSQVCSRWRSIILQAPILWCKALNLVDSAMWVAKILRRTQAVPLDIHFDTAEDNTGYAIPNLTTILANYFERCANLHIEGYGDDIEEVLGTAITASEAPFLRSLLICNISCSKFLDSEANIPDSIFSISIPCLTSLHLEGCIFSWDVIRTELAPHSLWLSSLRIRNFRIQSAGTVSQLLSVLALLPGLEDLWLQDSFVDGETDRDTRVCTVHLGKLTSLYFESSIMAAARLLGALRLPLLARLDAVVDAGQHIREFMEGLQLATRQMGGLFSLRVLYTRRLLVFQSNHNDQSSMLQVTFKDWVCPELAIPDTRLTDLIRSIPTVVAVQRVEDFWVSLPVGIEEHLADPDTWSHFFRRLSMISSITLGAHPPAFLIRTLYLDAHHHCTQAQSRLLPSLERITLPPIYEFEVLADVLAEAWSRVGIPLTVTTTMQHQSHMPQRTVQPLQPTYSIRPNVLAWLADPAVHRAQGHSWLVDYDGVDSDESEDE
ncbi:hypothetical protein BKA82DRAFT_4357720 [Pisolithus tinctorius]|nr:hypothetical protein BKA82DRAFT_4362900 [Pisolithus tinctorius]KAI6145622.1 hypothetical protein BKA82DRAFT_4357720 [Pisolithus tinctorius]